MAYNRFYSTALVLCTLAVSIMADAGWRADYLYERPQDRICNLSKYASGLEGYFIYDGCSFAELTATDVRGNDLRSLPLGNAGENFGASLLTAAGGVLPDLIGRTDELTSSIHSMYVHKETLFVVGTWSNAAGDEHWVHFSWATFSPKAGTKLRSEMLHAFFQLPAGSDTRLQYALPLYFADNFGGLDDDVDLDQVPSTDVVFLLGGQRSLSEVDTAWQVTLQLSEDSATPAPGGAIADYTGDFHFLPVGAARYDFKGDPLRWRKKDAAETAAYGLDSKGMAWIVGFNMDPDLVGYEEPSLEWRLAVQTMQLRVDGTVVQLWDNRMEWDDEELEPFRQLTLEDPEQAPGYRVGDGFESLGDGDDFMLLSWMPKAWNPGNRKPPFANTKTLTRQLKTHELHTVYFPKTYLQKDDWWRKMTNQDAMLVNDDNNRFFTACEGALVNGVARCVVAQPLGAETVLSFGQGNGATELTITVRGSDQEGVVTMYDGYSSLAPCDLPLDHEDRKDCDAPARANGGVSRRSFDELGIWVLAVQVSNEMNALSYVTTACPSTYECRLIGFGAYDGGELYDKVFTIHILTWVENLEWLLYGNNSMKAGGVLLLGGSAGVYSRNGKLKKKKRGAKGEQADKLKAQADETDTSEIEESGAILGATVTRPERSTPSGGLDAERRGDVDVMTRSPLPRGNSGKSAGSRGGRSRKSRSSKRSRTSKRSRGSRQSRGSKKFRGSKQSRGSRGGDADSVGSRHSLGLVEGPALAVVTEEASTE